jgi:hypothetical protein
MVPPVNCNVLSQNRKKTSQRRIFALNCRVRRVLPISIIETVPSGIRAVHLPLTIDGRLADISGAYRQKQAMAVQDWLSFSAFQDSSVLNNMKYGKTKTTNENQPFGLRPEIAKVARRGRLRP